MAGLVAGLLVVVGREKWRKGEKKRYLLSLSHFVKEEEYDEFEVKKSVECRVKLEWIIINIVVIIITQYSSIYC